MLLASAVRRSGISIHIGFLSQRVPLGSPLCYGVRGIFPTSCLPDCQPWWGSAPLLPGLPGCERDLQAPLCMLLRPYVQGRELSVLSAWGAEGMEIKNMVVKIK